MREPWGPAFEAGSPILEAEGWSLEAEVGYPHDVLRSGHDAGLRDSADSF